MASLLERQRELLALRTTGAFLVEALNGKYTTWMADDLSGLQAIAARLADEFADLNGKGFADELLNQLAVKP